MRMSWGGRTGVRGPGLTLVELLVAVALVGILAAILLPVFAKAREKARQSHCLGNLRQLALAAAQYAQDYDERAVRNEWTSPTAALLPGHAPAHRRTALHLSQPYLKSVAVTRCPSSADEHREPAGDPAALDGAVLVYDRSYGYSDWVAGRALSTIPSPSSLFWIVEARLPWSDDCQNAVRLCHRHQEGANLMFVDGHAKWRRSRSEQPSEWWPGLTGFYGTPDGCGGYPVAWRDLPPSPCVP